MKNILVTGANGFIGNETLKYFQSKKLTVKGITIDICNKELLRPHFIDTEFVIHAAGKVKKGIPNPDDYETINVGGTKNIIDLCIEYNCKLIHLSSIATEGPYGISKQVSQKLVEYSAKKHDLMAIILRLCVIYNKENDTGRRGARYPIEKLLSDIENLIQTNNFNEFKIIDFSDKRG